ncbi:hypothetical protein D3C71_1555010 [compost metagenome]
MPRQFRDGQVRGVGRGAQDLRAAPFVPAPHDIGMLPERFGRRQRLRVETGPQARQCIPERGDAAFGGHTGPRENDNATRLAQRLRKRGRNIVMRVFHFQPSRQSDTLHARARTCQAVLCGSCPDRGGGSVRLRPESWILLFQSGIFIRWETRNA